MKHNTNNSPTVVTRWTRFLGAMVILALMVPAAAFSQAAPDLGRSVSFGILGGAAITGASVVTGNVGTTAGGVAGVTVGAGYTIYDYLVPAEKTIVDDAQTDLGLAYTYAATQTPTSVLSIGAWDLSTTGTFTPGVYSIGGAATMSTIVTLDGHGVYIFQITGSLSTAASLSLTNGALWTDIYWQVGDFAALGAAFEFDGTVMANNYITLGAGGAVMNGRLLSKTAYVTASGATVGGSEIPLPVEMASFTATANRTSANLHWSTATETNNYGFEIERRQTATWEKIGFVAGAGTSSSPRQYTYTDDNLTPGRYAYRVKQVNKDGSFSYHGSAQVEIGSVAKKFELASNFPNPFNPSTTVQFTLENDGVATLTVYNVLGQEVMTLFNDNAQAGKLYQVKFDASRLPTGLYFAKLQSGNQRMMQKMALVK